MIRRGLLFVCALALPLVADEGLWLFNQFPKDAVSTKYSFDVTDAFLSKLQLASMRLGSGSGSFVTAHGLIFTNHHVVTDCIAKLSASGRDYLKDGFYATTRAEELRCPGLESGVLLKIEDVTSQVKEPMAEAPKTPAKTAAATWGGRAPRGT